MKVTLKFAKCEPWLKRKKLDEKIILINKTLGYFIVFLSHQPLLNLLFLFKDVNKKPIFNKSLWMLTAKWMQVDHVRNRVPLLFFAKRDHIFSWQWDRFI